MWNRAYSNRICNIHDKTREQNLHLERLFTIKQSIDTREPYQPLFMKKHLAKEQMEEDKKIVIDYENRILRGKLVDVASKPSDYNESILTPKHCPAFDKKIAGYHAFKKQLDINVSNFKLFSRIAHLKANIETKDLLKDAQKKTEYKERISNGKNLQNPCLKFYTLEKFKKKLEIQLTNELMIEQTRPRSAITQPNNHNQTQSQNQSQGSIKNKMNSATKPTQSTNAPVTVTTNN